MVININLAAILNIDEVLFGEEIINKDGRIIALSSIGGIAGNMGQTNYTATKAGVAAMAVTWAKELARQGIRCAAIAPGYIGTEMVLTMKPEALEKIAAGIPAKRLGQPDRAA